MAEKLFVEANFRADECLSFVTLKLPKGRGDDDDADSQGTLSFAMRMRYDDGDDHDDLRFLLPRDLIKAYEKAL